MYLYLRNVSFQFQMLRMPNAIHRLYAAFAVLCLLLCSEATNGNLYLCLRSHIFQYIYTCNILWDGMGPSRELLIKNSRK